MNTETRERATLYDRLGGAPATIAAAELFYRKVLSDDRISHFFDDVDMDSQVAKQAAFLTMVFGGPNAYSGRDLRIAHARLVAQGLSDVHFDAVLENLTATLRELGVGEAETAEVAGIAESARPEVLNRPAS